MTTNTFQDILRRAIKRGPGPFKVDGECSVDPACPLCGQILPEDMSDEDVERIMRAWRDSRQPQEEP